MTIPRKTSGSGLALCLLFLLSMVTWAPPSKAYSRSCDEAAVRAAQRTGVPLHILRAVALTETGSNRGGEFVSWPWTVNAAGTGRWFDARGRAVAFASAHIRAGRRNVDIGCFQLNYRWHGAEFASIEAMFDPTANALYAARFLSRLHGEFGDWSKAVGAFHSRTPKFASRYLSRFEAVMARAGLTAESPERSHLAERPAPAAQAPVTVIAERRPSGPAGASLFTVSAAPLSPRTPQSAASLWRD